MNRIGKTGNLFLFCIFSVFTFGGCALFNPHRGPSILSVEEGQPDDAPNYQSQPATGPQKGGAKLATPATKPDATARSPKTKFKQNLTVNDALLYAYHQWDDYNEAVKEHSELNSSGGVVITGLTAASIAGGAAGISGKTVLGLAAGAGGSYAGVTFLHSTPRQLIYLAGMDAINCAILVTLPFDLSDADLASLTNAAHIDVSKLKDLRFAGGMMSLQLQNSIQKTINDSTQFNNTFQNVKIGYGTPTTNILTSDDLVAILEKEYMQLQSFVADGSYPDSIKQQIADASPTGIVTRIGDMNQLYQSGKDKLEDANNDLVVLQTELTNADQVISANPALITDANNLYGKYQMAAGDLVHQVNTIRTSVSAQILSTEPSLAALASALGVKAPQMVNTTGGTPSTTTPAIAPKSTNSTLVTAQSQDLSGTKTVSALMVGNQTPTNGLPDHTTEIINTLNDLTNIEEQASTWLKTLTPESQKLAQDIQDLANLHESGSTATSQLVAETSADYQLFTPIRSLIDRVNSQIGAASLADCVVSNSTQANISILPPSPITAYQGQTSQIFVQGGHPQYFVSWPVPSETNNFTVNQKMITTDNGQNQLELDVAVKSGTSVGTHVFFVTDLAAAQKTVILSVTNSGGTPTPAAPPNGTNNSQ